MISVVLDVLGVCLLLVGLVLLSIGLLGALRLRGAYTRLHAQSLATGPGVCAILASSIATEDPATIGLAVLGIVFTVLTAPVAGHAIARCARRGDTDDPY